MCGRNHKVIGEKQMIFVKNISYQFKDSKNKLIDNLSLKINDGEILGIIGETGSGKSTLLKIISKLESPSSGEVIFKNKQKNNSDYYKIGILFQNPEKQFFCKTIYDDLAYTLRIQKISEQKIKSKIDSVTKLLNINSNLLKKSHFTLSGGEKRKCALACILMTEPDVLILDEFTSGLDAKESTHIIKFLKAYHKNTKNIIIFVSHIMEQVAYLSDKILILEKNVNYLTDTPENIFKNILCLNKTNLDIPQIPKIIAYINRYGYNINTYTLDPLEAFKRITDAIIKKET